MMHFPLSLMKAMLHIKDEPTEVQPASSIASINMKQKLLTILQDPKLIAELVKTLPSHDTINTAIDEVAKYIPTEVRSTKVSQLAEQTYYARELTLQNTGHAKGAEIWTMECILKFEKVNNPFDNGNYYTVHKPGFLTHDSYEIAVVKKQGAGKQFQDCDIVALPEMFLSKYESYIISTNFKDTNIDVTFINAYPANYSHYAKLQLDDDQQITMTPSV